jgi:hypothetical protein
MKKLIISISLLLLSGFSPFIPVVYSQTEEELDAMEEDRAPVIDDVEGLRAEFRQYTQSFDTKEMRYEMVLHSNLNSDRVKITWYLTTLDGRGAIFKDKSEAIRYIEIKRGEAYSIPITIIPTGRGEVELLGVVESFRAEATFTVTVKKVFATNSLGEILPLTSDYQTSKGLIVIRNILIYLCGFVFIIFGSIKGAVYFRRWLRS